MPATVVAGATGDGSGLASVLLYGVFSVNMVAGTKREGAGVASVLLAGVASSLWWRADRKCFGLASPLFLWLAWAELLWYRSDI